MTKATHQDRQKALEIIENHTVEQRKQNYWVVLSKDGKQVDRATTKTMALFCAVSAEDKVDELLEATS